MNQTKTVLQDRTPEMRVALSAALVGDAVPTRVLLAPWGRVESSNGDFFVDDESIALAREAFEGHGTDLPIDYEHQTLGGSFASPTGQAPAAGWIKRLVGEPGVGLFAEIEWTPPGQAMLAEKQYRYLSPVAVIRKSDRKLIGIHSAALTNKPAIVGMTPIVNVAVQGDENDVAIEALREELGLPESADAHRILIVASERLNELRELSRRREIESRIDEAVKTGKLVESQRAWAEELVRREADLFDEWFRTAPVIVPMGATAPPNPASGTQRSARTIAARAQAEYRSHALLSRLTTEEAFVADALRNAGHAPQVARAC